MKLFYSTWLIKPIYGFLGDYLFPFYYRVKGYVVIFTLLAVASTTTMIALLPKISSNQLEKEVLLGVEFLNFLALGFIDAVCQGMTSMTVKLEKRHARLVFEQSITSEPSFDLVSDFSGIRHFLGYMIVRIMARPAFNLLSQGLIVMNKNSREVQFRIAHAIFCVMSILVLLFILLFLVELKVEQHLSSKRA